MAFLKFLAFIALLTLSACGGGGASNLVGQFVDDPVAGLSYTCTSGTQTTTGVTDANGQFNYQAGQSCVFKVGNVTLGSISSIPTDGKVTPQDVAGVSRGATDAPSALAIAQFLQSLNDGSSSGKIVISDATRTALGNAPAVNLVSSAGAVSQSDLQGLVQAAGKSLVSPTVAKAALDNQISLGVIDKAQGAVGANAPVVLNSISVASVASSNPAGLTSQLSAMGFYSDGSKKDITSLVSWSSSDSSMVSVDAAGLAKGLKTGAASVIASLTPQGSSTAVKGSAVQTSTDAILMSIAVSNSANPPAGLTDQLKATGTKSDGSTIDLTKLVTWTSADTKTLTVNANGLATGLVKGSTTVTASYTPAGAATAIVGTFAASVLDATPVNIAISYIASAITSIQHMASTGLQAILNFTDSSVKVVSSAVSWVVSSVSGGGNATVANDTTANTATLTGTSSGVISIIANYLGLTSNSLSLTVNPPVISGTAAVGAPLGDAPIKVYDSKGVEVGSGTTDASGQFSISLQSVGTPPYVLKLTSGEISLHAMHGDATNGTANITPISNAVVAMLSSTGSADEMLNNLKTGGTAPTKAQLDSKQEMVSAALESISTAAGVKEDIFKKPFSTNGVGVDKLLDSVAINTSADGVSKKANVQIALKVATDPVNPTVSMPVLNLSSDTSKADAVLEKVRVGTISANDLPSSNAGDLYKDLLANLNACYKEAPLVRTDGTSVVKSDACKKIFLNNDPTQYLNYGQRLSSTAQFSGMFTYAGEVVFMPVDKPYLVQDLNGSKRGDGVGRAIVALSWVNENGNRENIMLYTTKYTHNGKEILGLSGDRNTYGWSVNSHNQKREFPLRGDTALDYVTGSYLISVRDIFRNSKSVVRYATVIAPNGKKTLLASVNGGAARDLAICKKGEVVIGVDGTPTTPLLTEETTYGLGVRKYYCTGTSKSITMAQRFISDTETRVPSDIFNAGILRPLDASGNPYTPTTAELTNMPSIGAWTIIYTFMDGTTATQKTWSVARPMTTGELMGPDGPDAVLPKYTTATVDALKALKTSQTTLTPCYSVPGNCDASQSPIPVPSTGGFKFAWFGSNKVPVTSLWISGWKNASDRSHISSTGATTWDDQLLVRSTTRQAEIQCSRQSTSDSHCESSVAVNGLGSFNLRAWMTYSEMWGKDAEQRTHMRSFNWYQPTKNSAGESF
jgi:hypothetical protein